MGTNLACRLRPQDLFETEDQDDSSGDIMARGGAIELCPPGAQPSVCMSPVTQLENRAGDTFLCLWFLRSW